MPFLFLLVTTYFYPRSHHPRLPTLCSALPHSFPDPDPFLMLLIFCYSPSCLLCLLLFLLIPLLPSLLRLLFLLLCLFPLFLLLHFQLLFLLLLPLLLLPSTALMFPFSLPAQSILPMTRHLFAFCPSLFHSSYFLTVSFPSFPPSNSEFVKFCLLFIVQKYLSCNVFFYIQGT